ncbi:MAG: ATP-binding protein [Prevotella sp.]|nr:ATP-binding protein [Prevotella sp.]
MRKYPAGIQSFEKPYKQLPLGISDFKRIALGDYYYVDKTMFIPRLEAASSYLFFVRPRRFGKSLMLSLLHAYYDISEANRFEELFGRLWIGTHPTPLHNHYAVLHLDFSLVTGTIDELNNNFNQYCGMVVDAFADQYEKRFFDGFAVKMAETHGAVGKLNYLGIMAKKYDVPLYLIVDEYDNFTNTVLSQHGEDVYRGLTHGEGFYRDIFKLFKPNFERILMIGVSPVTMDDLTSGYNIATNITSDRLFNQMLGFSEVDVRQMLDYYHALGLLNGSVEDMVQEMKPWYNNYCFAKESFGTESRMFNGNMVLYYLNEQLRNGHAPEAMTDPNTRTDYQKMKRLIQLDKLDGQRRSIILQIAEEGSISGNIVPYFPASGMVLQENFVSLLYYYGMLTITGVEGFELRLGIPNNNVRKQYYSYLLEQYDSIAPLNMWQISQYYNKVALYGDWQPMFQLLASEYEKCCAVRSLMEGERNMQGFFTALLTQCPYYLIAPELELNHGYCDFFLMPDLRRYPMINHSYIIELKYLKQGSTDSEKAAQWQEAVGQLLSYTADEKVRLLCGCTTLHPVIMQFCGHTMIRMEEIDFNEK